MHNKHRTEINRANAQHSTGPKTANGKKKSSLNALRHGLTSQIVVMPTEDLEAYQLHVKSLTDEYLPKGATEALLVQAIADASWRLNRVAALETNVLMLAAAHQPDPCDRAPAQIQHALSIAASLESQSKALSNLSMHSQRLSRQFERAVQQLRGLQQTRKAEEKKELDNLCDIYEMHHMKGEDFDYHQEGFVFSRDEINVHIQARNRVRLGDRAYQWLAKRAAA